MSDAPPSDDVPGDEDVVGAEAVTGDETVTVTVTVTVVMVTTGRRFRGGVSVVMAVIVFGAARQGEAHGAADERDDRHRHGEPRRLRVDVEPEPPAHPERDRHGREPRREPDTQQPHPRDAAFPLRRETRCSARGGVCSGALHAVSRVGGRGGDGGGGAGAQLRQRGSPPIRRRRRTARRSRRAPRAPCCGTSCAAAPASSHRRGAPRAGTPRSTRA